VCVEAALSWPDWFAKQPVALPLPSSNEEFLTTSGNYLFGLNDGLPSGALESTP
jgi:hypothetical protein